jgi:RNA polymerase sigma factor (sigma-70 family)
VAGRLERAGVAPTAESVLERLRQAPLADLAIAIACADRVPGAWETLVARLGPRLVGLAHKRGVADTEARTLADDVLSEMCVPVGGRPPIETYAGAGSLFGWAAVILVRRLHRARHGAGRPVATADEPPERVAAAPDEPLDRVADDERVRRFGEALAAAWSRLSGRERLALACRYVDGMPQTRIATLLRVSEPHTSRILAAAVESLRGELRATLGPDALARAGPALAEALRRRLVSESLPPPHPVEEPPRPRGPR